MTSLPTFCDVIHPQLVPRCSEKKHGWWQPTFSLSDMKESKDALQPPTSELGLKSEANGEPLAEAAVPEKPEVELSNLVTCSKLAQSQASLHSASSVGSVRGDEGGAYSEFFGDYVPLFDNRQDPDNVSLQGWCRWCPASSRGWGTHLAGTWRVCPGWAAGPVPLGMWLCLRWVAVTAGMRARGEGADGASSNTAPRDTQPGWEGWERALSTGLHW